jgi:TetR/AcrR family transcriptional repressor of tetCD
VTVKTRRQLISEDTREQLARSAARLFSKKPYADISVDDIAADAQMTKGAFYHHFPSKLDIFETCFQTQIHELAEEVRVISMPDDPTRWAEARAEAFLTVVLKRGRRLIGLDTAITVLGWTRWKTLDTEVFIPLIEEPLRALQAQGSFGPAQVNVVAEMLHAMLFNAAMMIAHSPAPAETKEVSLQLVNNFLESLMEEA